MPNQGGAADPWSISRPEYIMPITSGSSPVYPTTDANNIVSSYVSLKSIMEPDDKESRKKLDKLAIQYLEWQIKEYKKVYARQVRNGKFIFIIIIGIVLLGLLFTIVQFGIALIKGTPINYSISIGATSMQIDSSLVGVLVLIVSLIFFYLFLRFAYIQKPPSDFVHLAIRDMKKKEK